MNARIAAITRGIGCAIIATLLLAPGGEACPESPILEPEPGLVIEGHVRTKGGAGVAHVGIFRALAVYPAERVATTDQDGYFRSEFLYIPGDEMVTVWAARPGSTFAPDEYYWRHYHSYEVRTLDFIATPIQQVHLPLVTR